MKSAASCTIGIVGTGLLGTAVATHLLESNCNVVVYNRTRDKTVKIREKGARVVDTPAELARICDIVLIIVSDASAVHDVAFGEYGLVHGVHKDMIVGDMSTIGPSAAREITKRFQRVKVTKIDIPVMGGPNVAIDGKLTMMISGSDTAYHQIKDVLEIISDNHFFVGDDGNAQTIKLAMNMQITAIALGLSEGIALTSKDGIDPNLFLKVLNSTYFGTGMSKRKAYKMITDSPDPTFTLANLRKDIRIMNDTANSLGLDLPMIQRADEVYSAAVADGFGDLDYTGIIRYIEER